MSFARGDATAGDRERASKLSSLKKHVNRSPAEGDRDRGSRPRDAEPSQHTGAEGGQKQLTPRAAIKKSSPLDPSSQDPEKLVVPAQHPDADACARDEARIPTIAYQRAGRIRRTVPAQLRPSPVPAPRPVLAALGRNPLGGP